MKFSIRHTTTYHYSQPVWDSFNDAHLCPVTDDFQKCQSFDLEINPPSGSVLRRLDFYTNPVHHFEVMEPHTSLVVTAHSLVETFRDTRDHALPIPRASLSGLERDDRYYDFLSTSPRIALGPMWTREATEIVGSLDDVRQQVEAIMRFIYQEFSYVAGSTHVASKIEEVFPQRRGVCQDFAHIMIALCRAAKIPTRYVSGYFYVERPVTYTAKDSTVSHAWVECFLPGIGWVAYDPTHNRRADDSYVELARGRDYGDVRPLAGTYRGSAEVKMQVSVEVDRTEASCSPA